MPRKLKKYKKLYQRIRHHENPENRKKQKRPRYYKNSDLIIKKQGTMKVKKGK